MNTIKLNTIGERPTKKGGASGGGGNWVYIDLNDIDPNELAQPIMYCAMLLRWTEKGATDINTPAYFMQNVYDASPTAMAVDLSAKKAVGYTMEDYIRDTYPEILDLPRLTEQEFYPQPKNHSISGEIYVFDNQCSFGWNMYTGGFVMPAGSTLTVNGNVAPKNTYNEYHYDVNEVDGWYPFELKFTQAVTNLDCFGAQDTSNGGYSTLRNLDFSKFDASTVTSISQGAFEFWGDVLPQTLDLSMCNFENVEMIGAFNATSYEKESSFTLKLDGYMPKLWTWGSYLDGVVKGTLMYKKENEQYITGWMELLAEQGWTVIPY